MFSEVVHGILVNSLRLNATDPPTVETELPRPKWRVGIIPAGMFF